LHRSAAVSSAGAIRYATDVQNEQYNKSLALLDPSIRAGDTARSYQLGALGLPGGVDRATAEAAFRDSPGYQFRLGQGLDAVGTSAARGGNFFSGKTLKSLNNYASGMADQTFGDWYNRVGGISGSGETATGRAIAAGSSNASNLADLALRGGDAKASSYGTIAGAVNSGLGSLADLYYRYNPVNTTGSLGGIGSPQTTYVRGGLN
jgi:hypothetical protein